MRLAVLSIGIVLATAPASAQDDSAASTGAANPGAESATAASVGEASPDVERVRAALAALGLHDAQVTAEAGVLRLDGTVSSPEDRTAAEEVAAHAADWLMVVNDLEVAVDEAAADTPSDPDRELEGWLRRIFGEVEELSGIEVEARSGIVHLTGRVPTEEAAERAAELAGAREGVVYVDRDVTVDRSVDTRVENTWSRLEERARDMVARLPLYGVALLVVVLGGFVASRLRRGERRRRENPLLRAMWRQVFAAVIFVGALLLALDLLEATAVLGALLGTAGVVGLALGFAFKDIIENYLASVLLAVRRPFAPDDLVKIGEHEGKVVRLTSRDTVLMTLDGNHVRMPNAEVFKSVTTNYTLNPLRGFWVDVGVGVNEDLTVAQRVALEALRAMPGVAEDPPPFTRIEELGDWSVQMRAFGWVDQREYDWYKVKSEGTRRVKVALDDADIDMPFPTYVRDGAVAAAGKERRIPVTEAPGHDVAADHVLDDQVEADRAASGEEDLLTESR